MTGAHTLAARAALGGVAAVCSVALCRADRQGRFAAAGQRVFDSRVLGALVVSRLGLYLLVFFGLGIPPRGDIPFFYWPEGVAVLRNHLPYRDFPSSYAPLHGFLDAAVLRLWNSPLALILFAIALEAVALPVFLRVARCGFGESRVRLAALLYVASPVSLQFVAIDGQDNILVALLLAIAVLCLCRGRAVLSGASLALAIVLVKFLPLLFLPLLLMACRQRGRWLLGFGGVLAMGYLPFAWLRLPLLYPLQAEGQARTASDLPYLIEAFFGMNLPGRGEDLVLLAALGGVLLAFGWALRRAGEGVGAKGRVGLVLHGCVALTLALLLFSKKSWPPYLMLVWFPVCLLATEARFGRWRQLAFAGFGWVAILAHSVWATVFLQALGPDLHARLTVGQPAAMGFLVMQLLLLTGYAWLLGAALRQSGFRLAPVRGEERSGGLATEPNNKLATS